MTKLSVEASLTKLELDELNKHQMTEALCGYINAGLTLYVNCDRSQTVTQGNLSNIEYEDRGHNAEEPHFVGLITTNHENVAVNDIISTCFVTVDQSTKKDLLVSCLKYKNKEYLACDETGQFPIQFRVDNDSAYFLTKDIASFKAGSNFTPKSNYKGTVSSVDGLTKALALLIHDMASGSKGAQYRTGKKVNSSAIKEHILGLAAKYNVNEDHIKSIHNKITPLLTEHALLHINNSTATKK
jgi:hypothetical protein|tara:strand:- start:156 stop:881 length:726 start_codon:yes stop_codon:yes gene_type:complete